ncbi:MAG TPA: hypothetical protein VFS33_05090 [Gemmatimonadales bacterium]|nr:hypothetical protein [Gemmatimonadales bacterium]
MQLVPPQCGGKLEAALARHDDVRDHQADRVALLRIELECGHRVGCFENVVTMSAEGAGKRPAHAAVVFDDQHGLAAIERARTPGLDRRFSWCLSFVTRQQHGDHRALAHGARHIDASAGSLHDPVHRGEPEARALLLLGGEERLEDSIQRVGIHANARIGYHQRQHGRGTLFRSNESDLGPQGQAAAGWHGVPGIGAQAVEDLLELHRIGERVRGLVGEAERDDDGFAHQAGQQPQVVEH